MGNRLDKDLAEDEAQDATGCAYCSEKVRLVSFKQLNPGDHICQGGRSFLRHMNRKQKNLYTHHAIVKKVICENLNDHSAVLTLIHYTDTPYDTNLKIRETTETRDLRLDEMYLVRYIHRKFQPNQVLDRAQKLLEHDPKYSLVSLNCEHFCTCCITGEEFSSQSENVIEKLKNALFSIVKVVSKIVRFCDITADDVANVVKKLSMNVSLLRIAAAAFSGLVLIVSLTTNIVKHSLLCNKVKNDRICKNCYNHKVRSMWFSLIFLSFPAIANILVGLLITSGPILAGILVPLSVLSLVMVWGSNKFCQVVRSPFTGDKIRVDDVRNVQVGDVILYQYYKLLHEAVVSSVDSHTGSKLGKVHVIHYGTKSLFSTREIIKEELKINLDKMEIFKLDYSCYTVYPPEEVVLRAGQRIGEKKFGVFTNRSCHFCHWAKVNENFDTILTLDQGKYPFFHLADFPHQVFKDQSTYRPPSTSLIKKTWIKIKSEVRDGNAIQFTYRGHLHKGICTKVITTETARELKLNVVHYSYQEHLGVHEVREEAISFDLSVENVYIYHYHPAHRYSRKEIIDRARTKIGEKKYRKFSRNSSHLVEEIILKDKEEVINSPSELCEGDIVSFFYWGKRHKAVLVSIDEDNGDKKCSMQVIHYGSLSGVRTVVEEKRVIDLAGHNLRKVNFSEYFTYPGNMVIKRARKRLGEQKYSLFHNNSSQLAHWAKVDSQIKDI
ncbi:hypothetical protein CHS0354_038796 [Potamilus streckersoni]|uniref:LRAT domain-containing protein n=1 Tax=Potamilus streckersoni TaxID=2493646 RepID=A0AAE0WAM2_9BIVA|nr:hypothetical protein CHS0354_038796 [Potamilus streckersoni]